MMHRLNAVVIALWLAFAPACAQVGQIPAWPPKQVVSSGGGCTQATSFLARVSNHTNDTLYTTMICGMVTDGVWAKLDLLYIFAANNTTDALLNIIGSTTTVLSATAPTFTANTGYTGNGSSATINVTGYNFNAGTNYTQNAASLFGWSTESGVDNGYVIGNSANFNTNDTIQPFSFSSTTIASVNGATTLATSSTATGLGLFTASRTSSVQFDLYQNASNVATSGANTSAAIVSANPWFLGLASTAFYGGGVAAGGVGGALTSTDVTNLYGRIHTFLHAVNPGTFP